MSCVSSVCLWHSSEKAYILSRITGAQRSRRTPISSDCWGAARDPRRPNRPDTAERCQSRSHALSKGNGSAQLIRSGVGSRANNGVSPMCAPFPPRPGEAQKIRVPGGRATQNRGNALVVALLGSVSVSRAAGYRRRRVPGLVRPPDARLKCIKTISVRSFSCSVSGNFAKRTSD